jgi:hypothetical protein
MGRWRLRRAPGHSQDLWKAACGDTVNRHVDPVCLRGLTDPLRDDVEPVGRVATDTGSHLESLVLVSALIVYQLVSRHVEGIAA